MARSSGSRGLRGEHGSQGLALEVLHREVGDSLVRRAEVVDGADLRVNDPAGVLGFPGESLQGFAIAVLPRRKDLQGTKPVHQLMAGEIHRPHAARAEAADDLVAIGEDGARGELVGRGGGHQPELYGRGHMSVNANGRRVLPSPG
jgi:hypothetical protein